MSGKLSWHAFSSLNVCCLAPMFSRLRLRRKEQNVEVTSSLTCSEVVNVCYPLSRLKRFPRFGLKALAQTNSQGSSADSLAVAPSTVPSFPGSTEVTDKCTLCTPFLRTFGRMSGCVDRKISTWSTTPSSRSLTDATGQSDPCVGKKKLRLSGMR